MAVFYVQQKLIKTMLNTRIFIKFIKALNLSHFDCKKINKFNLIYS